MVRSIGRFGIGTLAGLGAADVAIRVKVSVVPRWHRRAGLKIGEGDLICARGHPLGVRRRSQRAGGDQHRADQSRRNPVSKVFGDHRDAPGCLANRTRCSTTCHKPSDQTENISRSVPYSIAGLWQPMRDLAYRIPPPGHVTRSGDNARCCCSDFSSLWLSAGFQVGPLARRLAHARLLLATPGFKRCREQPSGPVFPQALTKQQSCELCCMRASRWIALKRAGLRKPIGRDRDHARGLSGRKR